MLEDICFYWTQHNKSVVVGDEPAIATFFLKKILASNYMLCIQHVKSLLRELDFLASRKSQPLTDMEITWAEEQWKNLQAWSRQCSEYCDSIESLLDSFGIRFCDNEASSSWISCKKDSHLIRRKFLGLKNRSDAMTSSFAGLAGILGNRQALNEAQRSLHEARSVKILTLLGMFFLPLSFTSGLLSMNDKYLPGETQFWIYFVLAVPLVLAVFGAMYLVKMGSDANGAWSLRQLARSLVKNKW